jgi:hypothetical protein
MVGTASYLCLDFLHPRTFVNQMVEASRVAADGVAVVRAEIWQAAPAGLCEGRAGIGVA